MTLGGTSSSEPQYVIDKNSKERGAAMKVAIIIPYFGRRPPYFDLFVKSCERIKYFHWHFLTDCIEMPWASEQITIHRLSLVECKRALEQAIGFPIVLHRPYKLCDYKPVYGLAFPWLIEGYTHWGFGDVDLLMGDIDTFFLRFLDGGMSKFMIRGHCSIFENTQAMLQLFKHGAPEVDFHKVATTDAIFAFDEWGGMAKIYRHLRISVYDEPIMADIHKDRDHLSLTEKNQDIRHQAFFWHEGRLRRFYLTRQGGIEDDEFCYIHLQKRQMIEPSWGIEPLRLANCIAIDPHQFRLIHNLDKRTIRESIDRNAPSLWNNAVLYAGKARKKISNFMS